MKDYFEADFFTPIQVARKLQLNVITIYSYIKKGALRAAKFGRNYRISGNDLHNFIKANKTH